MDLEQKEQYLYVCQHCDFKCIKKTNWNRHLTTQKHNRLMNANDLEHFNDKFQCFCGKQYNHMSSLCKHKQKCILDHNIDTQTQTQTQTQGEGVSTFTPQMFYKLLKQNNEFKELLVEQNKQLIELSGKVGNNSTNNSNNIINNSFNLQFFLNETCKDALNITDFVNQLQVGIKDLEETGRLGYAEGISKIFINGLKQLDVNKRPVHCSDSKRETMHIKDSDQWSNENEILTNAIRDVAHKNIQQIPVWTEKHPEHKDLSSKYNDKYMKLVSEAMPGSTTEESDKNCKKIMRNIMKESVIEK